MAESKKAFIFVEQTKIILKMTSIITTTNQKLNAWYKNAEIDFDIKGSAQAKIENNNFIINYTENGVSKKWQTPFYPEYADFGEDYFFRCWAEEAN